MAHVSYNAVVSAAKMQPSHDGYYYAIVELGKRDTMTNPASTKHDIYGPGTWLWIIHPTGITLRHVSDRDELPLFVLQHAADFTLDGDLR